MNRALFLLATAVLWIGWFLMLVYVTRVMPSTRDGLVIGLVEAVGFTFLAAYAFSWLVEWRDRDRTDRRE